MLADNVTNFARLLLTLDNDSNTENGIQLNTDLSSNLGTIDNISDFNVDNLTAAHGVNLTVSKEAALQHLHESMRRKNLGLAQYFQHPDPGQVNVASTPSWPSPLLNLCVNALLIIKAITKAYKSVTLVPDLSGSIQHQANRLWFVPSAGLSPNTKYTVSC